MWFSITVMQGHTTGVDGELKLTISPRVVSEVSFNTGKTVQLSLPTCPETLVCDDQSNQSTRTQRTGQPPRSQR